LFFATAEALSRAVEPELGPALYLVLGCRRVGYIDHGAFEVLADLVALAQASGLVAVLAEASAMLENDMVPASIAALRSFGDLDSALEMALLDEGSRSSTAVADEDSVCRALSRHALTEMEHGPGSEIVPVLFKNLAKSLFRRLRETNEMVRALE
jgi:CRP-like cAMP-binding protein